MKMKNTRINLEKGYILKYEFNNINVYNYSTNDYLNDQVIMLEKNGKLVIIESPTFYDNNKELEEYIKTLNLEVEGILLAYHFSGASFLEGKKKYATHQADTYGHEGGGKILVDNFTKTFGTDIFDNKIHNVTDYISGETVAIADIELNIIKTDDSYDIEIPEINSIYTHMLGSKCHSIIAGVEQADKMIATLKEYIVKDYNLIFTSHYIPEDISAVEMKISYIETILNIASDCSNSEEMIKKVKLEYKEYSGDNYLEMTANFFFSN